MKLEINKSYILFTNSDYILNKKIRVLSYMNYDRASEYASFTENVAINEKFNMICSFSDGSIMYYVLDIDENNPNN